MSLLRARALTLTAGERTLCSDLELEVQAGEVVAITGRSGAGKSTLLRVLALLDEPAKGEIEDSASVAQYRRRCAFVSQRPTLRGGSVRDELARAFSYKSAGDQRFDEELAAAELRGLGLSEVMAQEGASLSEGERQRVCLVRALLLKPRVLLLDEPSSALDAESLQELELRLGAFVNAGGAIVLVTHDDELRGRLATRTLAL